jgi:hypothetical protein
MAQEARRVTVEADEVSPQPEEDRTAAGIPREPLAWAGGRGRPRAGLAHAAGRTGRLANVRGVGLARMTEGVVQL